jgi:hypothetical protein
MSPIPTDPHKRPPPEVTLSDGRKFKLKAPGLEPLAEPRTSSERGAAEPPRDDPRQPIDPNVAGAG